jgi:hypothetical protein
LNWLHLLLFVSQTVFYLSYAAKLTFGHESRQL